jgi:hypothetical protein
MTTAFLVLALMVLSAALLMQEYRHSNERKDLLTRIMAKDLTEYNQVMNQRPPPKGGNFIRTGLKRYQEAIRDAPTDQR